MYKSAWYNCHYLYKCKTYWLTITCTSSNCTLSKIFTKTDRNIDLCNHINTLMGHSFNKLTRNKTVIIIIIMYFIFILINLMRIIPILSYSMNTYLIHLGNTYHIGHDLYVRSTSNTQQCHTGTLQQYLSSKGAVISSHLLSRDSFGISRHLYFDAMLGYFSLELGVI